MREFFFRASSDILSPYRSTLSSLLPLACWVACSSPSQIPSNGLVSARLQSLARLHRLPQTRLRWTHALPFHPHLLVWQLPLKRMFLHPRKPFHLPSLSQPPFEQLCPRLPLPAPLLPLHLLVLSHRPLPQRRRQRRKKPICQGLHGPLLLFSL